METQRFTRNPVEVEAVQVTPTNVAEVAKWCKGTVTEAEYRLMGGTHKLGAVLLHKQGPQGNKTRLVLIGGWITKHKNAFKAWTQDAFANTYTPVDPELKNGDLVRANNDSPFYNWEGKIADAHLIGVDFGARGKVVFEPSWLDKIEEMSDEQLQLNAGVDKPQSPAGLGETMAAEIERMREENREKIEAMEKENLQYDDVIRLGDLVKIVKHPQLSQPPANVGQCGHVTHIVDVPSADGPTKDYWVEFATADPENSDRIPYELVCLEKLRQDGEALNLESRPELDEGGELSGLDAEKALPTRQRVRINAERSPYNGLFGTIQIVENPDNYIVSIDDHDDGEGGRRFCRDELIPIRHAEEGIVAINDLREDLGMPRVPELEGVAADPRAIENHRIITETLDGMTPEEAAKVKEGITELQELIRRKSSYVETAEVEETAVRISREQDISYLEALQKVVGRPIEEIELMPLAEEALQNFVNTPLDEHPNPVFVEGDHVVVTNEASPFFKMRGQYVRPTVVGDKQALLVRLVVGMDHVETHSAFYPFELEKIVPFVEKGCSKCGKWSWDSKTGSYNETHRSKEGGPLEPCDWDGEVHEDFGPQDPSEVPEPVDADALKKEFQAVGLPIELDFKPVVAPLDLKDFNQNDKVRIVKEEDSWHGSVGTVTVVGVEEHGIPHVEVKFTDAEIGTNMDYGLYLPSELEII